MPNNNDKLNSTRTINRTSLVFSQLRVCVLSAVLLLEGCVQHHYVPEPINVSDSYQQIQAVDHKNEGFREFLRANHYPVTEWPIKNWDLQALTLAAVYFNPAVQVARTELEVEKAGQVIASQRPNPTLGIPLEHHSDPGDSPWLIGVVTDFLFERKDKREAKLQQAIANTEAARIKVEQQAWSLYSQLHQALIDYFSAIKQKQLLLAQKELLKENLSLLERRQELGQVSPFEVSSVRLELQHINLRLSDQDYVINDTFHKLIANTGLQANKFEPQNIHFGQIQNERLLQGVDNLQIREGALNSRFDIRIKLKTYEAYEAALKLEIQKQYPDLNLSPGFVFDQGDRIWMLGAAWILPLFHNNEGEIQQALANRTRLQAEFIQMQTGLVNELDRKYQNYTDKLKSYNNTKTLISELQERVKQVQKQFDLGYLDKLSVVRARLEVEKAKQATFAIEIDLLKAVERIERLMQQPLMHGVDIKSMTDNLVQNNN